MNINNLSKAGIIIASLCAASSVLAATPTTGVTNISGKLVASTCVVTIPTTYNVPAFTVQQIGAAGANGELHKYNGNFKLTSCTGVTPQITLRNSSGDGLGKGADQAKGLFTYDHKPAGAAGAADKGPLMFAFWLANKSGSYDGLNLNNTGKYGVGDNQSYRIYVYRFGTHSAEGFQGSYRTTLTMTVNYG